MASVKVFDQQNKEVGQIDLAPEVFEVAVRPEILHLVVRAQLAAKRAGTHKVKTRSFVSGSGSKPWRQKGTGRARAGSSRSPLWGGGGVVFGPKPRDYSKKINAKVKSLAFQRAFFDRAIAGEIDIIEKLEVPNAKTKALNGVVTKIAPKGKVLIVDTKLDDASSRAARNLARVATTEASNLNTTELCRYGRILLTSSAMDAVVSRLKGA